VASFVLGVVTGVGTFVLIAILGVMAARSPGRQSPPPPEVALLGLGLIACGLLAFVGVVLGLVGLVLPGRKRVLSILGMVFNGLVVLGFVGLIVIGLAAR
jgi:hypothetical protein